ncbi:putative holin-like toxin [Alkalihalobacillus clausii]|nr:putative holin-like toxin [Shouchella clausii]
MKNNSITVTQGWSAHSHERGCCCMTVFEGISLMLTFGLLIVAMLSFHNHKK